jgi:valyl-tRNA synthetase
VIQQHGADALRYSLVTGSAPGNDVPLAMEKIEGNRCVVRYWCFQDCAVQPLDNLSDSLSQFAPCGSECRCENLPQSAIIV